MCRSSKTVSHVVRIFGVPGEFLCIAVISLQINNQLQFHRDHCHLFQKICRYKPTEVYLV